MRIVHYSQSDALGGANKAAFRLHRALCTLGLDSVFAAGRPQSTGEDIRSAAGVLPPVLTAFSNAATTRPFRRSGKGFITPSAMSYGRLDPHLVDSSDVVCLHWIAGAFLRAASLRVLSRKPLIWRLSDCWPFTGGCHYPGTCRRFEERCGACPHLGSQIEWDITRHGWHARKKAYRDLDLTVVAPSHWIASCAKASSLFMDRPVCVIHTGVDLQQFRPRNRMDAREQLGLPRDRKLVLFGALGATDDPRKGYAQLLEALARLEALSTADDLSLVVFGNDAASDQTIQGPNGEAISIPTIMFGVVSDREKLATLYAAADVLVCPSLEDNLPNVALEAIACGTPVAAFNIGGMPDIVDDGLSGRLVGPGDAEAMAHAITDILASEAMGERAREKAEHCFNLADCAKAYRSLFESVIR